MITYYLNPMPYHHLVRILRETGYSILNQQWVIEIVFGPHYGNKYNNLCINDVTEK